MIKKISSLFLALVFAIASPILGDGLIFINHPFPTPAQPARLNVKYHNVNVTINNQVAVTKVDQVFENPYNYELEGTYIFPIPEHADINNFIMHVNEKPLSAKILDKDEAQKIYENIVNTHKDPALLEYIGRGMFQASVYPIPANGQIRLTLEYSEVLKSDNGSVKYYYTLNTENFSAQNLESASINLNIKSQQPISNVYSPTHKIDIQSIKETEVNVVYKEKNVRPDHDFVLYYTLPKDEIGFNVLTYKEENEDGFFLAMASPNNNKEQKTVIAKNILFVLDVSGSMYGEKIEQAKQALNFCLKHLNPEDRFNIIAFNTEVNMYKDGLVDASYSNVLQATSFVNNLYANNGTDINKVLRAALTQLPTNNNSNMVIFLTDGEPTVGETNIGRIIGNIKGANSTNTRLFSFGVGYDVNTTLLDKLSLDNKGVSDYITPNENIELKVAQFYTKVANPILTDISLIFTGTEVKEIYPITLPDIFQGSQLMIFGRYTKGGKVELDLSGKQNQTEKYYLFSEDFATNNSENDFLPRIWASRKIAHLIDQIILEGESKNLVDDIIALSKKYGIVTKYTSFLLDADAKQFASKAYSQAMAEEAFGNMSQDAMDQTGAYSVMRAKSQMTFRSASVAGNGAEAANISRETLEKVCNIRNRTFYLKDGVWMDAEHSDETQIIKVKPFSAEYFDLLKTNTELGAYFALGNKLIVRHGIYSISISDEEDNK